MSYRYRFFPALSVGLLSLLTPFALAADCTTARLAVYFSPSGGATDAVVREVNDAKKQILVQAYSFTSAPIAQALVDAPKRGVKILAVLDKSNETEKYHIPVGWRQGAVCASPFPHRPRLKPGLR